MSYGCFVFFFSFSVFTLNARKLKFQATCMHTRGWAIIIIEWVRMNSMETSGPPGHDHHRKSSSPELSLTAQIK